MGFKPIKRRLSVVSAVFISASIFNLLAPTTQEARAEAKSSFGAGHDPGRNGQKPQTIAAASMRQLMSLVEYIGGDYAGAVSGEAGAVGKVIQKTEYEEITQFSEATLEAFAVVAKARPKTPGLDSIEQELRDLKAAIAAKKSPDEVRALSRSVREHLIDAFQLTLAPAQVPQKALASAAFKTNCAACHGAAGHGDGVLSARLDPKPRDFADSKFAQGNSPFRSLNILHTGVAGTPMASFVDRLSGNEMWSLSFWVSGLAHDQKAALANLPEAVQTELKSKISLELLSRASDQELSNWVKDNIQTLSKSKTTLAAVVAALRVDAPYDGDLVRKVGAVAVSGTMTQNDSSSGNGSEASRSILNAKAGVAEAVSLANQGQFDHAKSKLLDAYLVGFEPAEKALRMVDPATVTAVEKQFVAARSVFNLDAPESLRNEAASKLNQALDNAMTVAHQTSAAASAKSAGTGDGDLVIKISQKSMADFFGSFLIIFREGFEAFLIIAALLAALANMGMTSARKWIHVGWSSALVLGVATFFVLNRLAHISGMGREMMEAVATGLAAAVLFYVGFWMLSQAERSHWDKFIRGGAREAVTSGKVWTLAGLAFIAVYREAAETVLFYNALSNSASSGTAVAGGFITGAASLGAICFGIQRYGLRMPLRKFFLSTSVLMVTLAVILAGKSVAEIIEAGMLEPVRIGFVPTLDLLGIYPYLQTLLAQGSLLGLAVAIWAWKRQSAAKITSLALSTVERSGN
jgi:high-affinity iron transporter